MASTCGEAAVEHKRRYQMSLKILSIESYHAILSENTLRNGIVQQESLNEFKQPQFYWLSSKLQSISALT
jgi:hypothetical protein